MSLPISQAEVPQKPIRCLVIQLARLGDTLQSLMALRAAQQLYPALEIHFIARERFAEAAKRVPWITQVIPLPTEALIGPLLQGKGTPPQAMTEIARWVSPLLEKPWDMVVNWSYSEASSFLSALIPSRIKLGYSRRKDLSLACTDGWSNYIQAIIQGKVRQNIHLTDILTTQLLTALQIHVGEPENSGDAPVTSKSFFTFASSKRNACLAWGEVSRKWIGIQLGAGREDKTWAPESWARLAILILKKHPETSIILLGGGADAERSALFRSQIEAAGIPSKRVISLVGDTDFDLWASAVGRCHWLLSADTAAIHLASVLGTRVLNVSVGPVQWTETGPYGNGHYVVAPALPCASCASGSTDNHTCRTQVSPDAIYAVWNYASSESFHKRRASLVQHFDQLEGPTLPGLKESLPLIQVFRSRIRNPGEGGGVCYEPLTPQPLDLDSWMSLVLGHVARAWYCGWVPPVGQELERTRMSPVLVRQLREMEESSVVLAKICEEASRTSSELQKKTSQLKSGKIMELSDREELQELGQKLMGLDTLMERVGKAHVPLRAFSQMCKVLMHNLQGEALTELGRETSECYRQLNDGVGILRAWLKHSLDMAKPVAVRAAQKSAPAPGPELSPS